MLRLLPTLDADGPTQMAWDEALLEASDTPTLRLYRWTPATVSLGYFQVHADIAAALPPGMAVVRRITGGGAIWHEHEVTYCLVGWLGRGGLPERMRDCYTRLHSGVVEALAKRGAHLALQPETVGDRRYRDEPRCFASPAADDVILPGGGKALGSAGRDRGGKILIHGSLKLASNPWDHAVVSGCGLDWDGAAAALIDGVAEALGLSVQPGPATSAEQAAMERVRQVRYGDEGWVKGRRGPRP